jgi:hypothetical protein
LHPILRNRALTFGAMTIAAGVIGNVRMTARQARSHMTTESGSAACLNGRHHFELGQAQMTRISKTIFRPMGAEYIRDLKL